MFWLRQTQTVKTLFGFRNVKYADLYTMIAKKSFTQLKQSDILIKLSSSNVHIPTLLSVTPSMLGETDGFIVPRISRCRILTYVYMYLCHPLKTLHLLLSLIISNADYMFTVFYT